MIVRPKLSWLGAIFSYRDSALAKTAPRTILFTLFSVVVTYLEMNTDYKTYSLTIAPFSIMGLAISVFLGFRTNVAYDRYWEGRRLWGSLVNVARSFARQTTVLLNCPDQQRDLEAHRFLVLRTIAFVHALRHHLRDTDPTEDLARFLSPREMERLQGQANIPLAVTRFMGERLEHDWQHGLINEFHLPVLEASLTEMTAIQGACERIKNTPVPFAYSALIHRVVGSFCLFLPFGIVAQVRWMTPIVVLLICHAFFGLDEISDEIEDPFGSQPQCLSLEALCRTIEVNLLQYIDEPNVPPMLKPVHHVLM